MQLLTQLSPFIDLETMDVQYFKDTYLTGFTFFGTDGRELPDRFFVEHISNALARVADLTSVVAVPTWYIGERHDYYLEDYKNYAWIQLYHWPVRQIKEIRMVLPDNQIVTMFPKEWVRLRMEHGQVQLLPTAGSLSQLFIGYGIDYVFIYARDKLPGLWQIDYEAGFDPKRVPRMVAEAIFKLACVNMLPIISDMVYPVGVTSQSLSVNGISQSRGYAPQAFKARIKQYMGELGLPDGEGQFNPNGLIIQVKNTYYGVGGVSV